MKRLHILLVILVLCMLPLTSALQPEADDLPTIEPDEPLDYGSEEFNWENADWSAITVSELPESVYTNQDFYANCPAVCYYELDGSLIDYANPKVKYSLLNYETIDYDNPDLNYDKINYDEANYDKLNYAFANYDEIQPAFINSQKFIEDFGCTQCEIDVGTQELSFSYGGITHPEGGFVSIPGDPAWPEGTSFTATENGIVVTVENIKEYNEHNYNLPFAIPRTDTVIFVTGEESVSIDGTTIKGEVQFDKGEIVILPNEVVQINGREFESSSNNLRYVKDPQGDYLLMPAQDEESTQEVFIQQTYISVPLANQETRIYFDSQERNLPQYIALDPTGDTLYAKTQDYMDITFFPENIYFEMDESSDNLHFELENADLAAFSRDEQGYVPEVIVTQFSGLTSFAIENGLTKLTHQLTDGNLEVRDEVIPGGFTTTPLTLEIIAEVPIHGAPNVQANLGEYYSPFTHTQDGEEITEQVYFSNYNEIALVHLGDEKGIRTEEFRDPGAETISTSLYYNYGTDYSKQQIEAQHGVPLAGDITSAAAKRLDEALQVMPAQMRHSITKITVLDDDEYAQVRAQYGGDHHEHSGAFTNALGEVYLKESNLGKSVILEEAAHARTVHVIETELAQQAQANYEKKKGIISQHLDEYQHISSKHDYSEDIIFDNTAGFVWKDSGTREARGDCVSAYACTNVIEKIGQAAGKTEAQVRDYIDPNKNKVDHITMKIFYTQLCKDGYWGGPNKESCYNLELLTRE